MVKVKSRGWLPEKKYNRVALRIKCMITQKASDMLQYHIEQLEESIENKGKWKRYNELRNNNYRYYDYMTVTEEEEGGYIYLGYQKVQKVYDSMSYHIFKIGQGRCAECRMHTQGLTKIIAIKVKDAKKVEELILNKCYNRNIERCRGWKNEDGRRVNGRNWYCANAGEIQGKEWFGMQGGVKEYEKMKNQLVEIVKDTIDNKNKIGAELQQLEEKEYQVWRKDKIGRYTLRRTNWFGHYMERRYLVRKFCQDYDRRCKELGI